MIKVTCKTARYTAKCGEKKIFGTFTPDGTSCKFFRFLSETAHKLTGSSNVVFDKEKKYAWGSAVFATANSKKLIIFLR